MAYQLCEFKREVDALIASGSKKDEAIFTIIRRYIADSKAIRFDGNGYSDEWKQEAAKRGLDCETCVPIIYDAYISESSIKLFKETEVLSERELHARNEVKEIYTKKFRLKLVCLVIWQ